VGRNRARHINGDRKWQQLGTNGQIYVHVGAGNKYHAAAGASDLYSVPVPVRLVLDEKPDPRQWSGQLHRYPKNGNGRQYRLNQIKSDIGEFTAATQHGLQRGDVEYDAEKNIFTVELRHPKGVPIQSEFLWGVGGGGFDPGDQQQVTYATFCARNSHNNTNTPTPTFRHPAHPLIHVHTCSTGVTAEVAAAASAPQAHPRRRQQQHQAHAGPG
jgi:hypothetical protein